LDECGKARLKADRAEEGSFVTGWVFSTIPVWEARADGSVLEFK